MDNEFGNSHIERTCNEILEIILNTLTLLQLMKLAETSHTMTKRVCDFFTRKYKNKKIFFELENGKETKDNWVEPPTINEKREKVTIRGYEYIFPFVRIFGKHMKSCFISYFDKTIDARMNEYIINYAAQNLENISTFNGILPIDRFTFPKIKTFGTTQCNFKNMAPFNVCMPTIEELWLHQLTFPQIDCHLSKLKSLEVWIDTKNEKENKTVTKVFDQNKQLRTIKIKTLETPLKTIQKWIQNIPSLEELTIYTGRDRKVKTEELIQLIENHCTVSKLELLNFELNEEQLALANNKLHYLQEFISGAPKNSQKPENGKYTIENLMGRLNFVIKKKNKHTKTATRVIGGKIHKKN